MFSSKVEPLTRNAKRALFVNSVGKINIKTKLLDLCFKITIDNSNQWKALNPLHTKITN